MNHRKSHVFDSVGFAFKELVEHVRLFVMVLLSGLLSIVVVGAVIAFLNKGFLKALLSSQALQDYQGCAGYECATVAYNSGAAVMGMVSANLFSVLISAVVLILFFIGLDLGLRKIALDLHDHHESSAKKLFSSLSLTPAAFVGWILYALMVWIGWIFFILPGFIALLRFAFFPYFIIDKHAGPIHALKMSWAMTEDHVWDIFAFWLMIKIIVFFGFSSGIGIAITWPLSTLAYAYYYRKFVPKR
ncbi:MAG TPA: hypothetical protein VHX42_03100 [Candidatus Babeliales bacterium]|jgi:uncharacterized membrane protein|nr:hypothetical protein [Candidatus Babeliales bacterium]